jgi:hypothetical protein
MRRSFDDFETNLPQNIKYNNQLTKWQHIKLFAKRKIGTLKKITQSLPKNPFVPPVIPPSLGTTPSSSHSPTIFLTPPPTPRASPTKSPPTKSPPTKSINHKSFFPTPRKYPTKSLNYKSLPTPRNYPTKLEPRSLTKSELDKLRDQYYETIYANNKPTHIPSSVLFKNLIIRATRNLPKKKKKTYNIDGRTPPTNSNSPEKKNYKKSPVKAGAPYIIKY